MRKILVCCFIAAIMAMVSGLGAYPTAVIKEVQPSENLGLALCTDLDTYHINKDEDLELIMYVRNPMYNTSVKVNYFFLKSDAFFYNFSPSQIETLRPQEVNIVNIRIKPKPETGYGHSDFHITADCLFYDIEQKTHYPGTVDSQQKSLIVTKYKNIRIIAATALVFGILIAIIFRKRWIHLVNRKFKQTRGTEVISKKRISQDTIDQQVEEKVKKKSAKHTPKGKSKKK